MAVSTPRQAQSLLFYAIIGLLLGVLIFTQPRGHYPLAVHYCLKLALLLVSMAVFLLNVRWAVPRLLYRRQVGRYVVLLALLVVGVTAAYGWVRHQLEAHYSDQAMGAPGHFSNNSIEGEPRGGQGPGRGEGGDHWLDPAVLLSTLLVLGLGTSVAAVQRGQREVELRRALEQEKTVTELSWLKAQLNPHFFFNTLNNIYALTLLDGDQAREALHRLSRLMRYVLYETQTGTAPLSQELQFVQDYLDLMQLRLTDDVTLEFERPAPLHDTPVAPLLLLTFVENAFKHGVSALAPSRISIRVRQPTPRR